MYAPEKVNAKTKKKQKKLRELFFMSLWGFYSYIDF